MIINNSKSLSIQRTPSTAFRGAINYTCSKNDTFTKSPSCEKKEPNKTRMLTAGMLIAVGLTAACAVIMRRRARPDSNVAASAGITRDSLKTFSREQILENYLTFLDYAPKQETLAHLDSIGENGKKIAEQYYNGDAFNYVSHNGEFSNNPLYANLLLNVLENHKETQKLNETALRLSKKYDEISTVIRTHVPNLEPSLQDNPYNNYTIDTNNYLSSDIKVFVLRDLIKKKYYSSLPSSPSEYCLQDPLASQKAREELIDTHLGWDLLNKTYSNDYSTSYRLINRIADSLNFNTEETDLINRLSQAERLTGRDSEVHSYEFAELGKAVRQKFGLTVD